MIHESKLFLLNEAIVGFTSRSSCQEVSMITEVLSFGDAKRELDKLIAPQMKPIKQREFEMVFRFLVNGNVGDHVEFGNVHCWTRIN